MSSLNRFAFVALDAAIVTVISLFVIGHDTSVATADEPKAEAQGEDDNEKTSDGRELNFLIRGRVTDEEGIAVAGATITTIAEKYHKQPAIATKSRPSGAFAIKVPTQGMYGPALMVTDPSGQLVHYISQFSYRTDERKLFNVVVKPWRITTVVVVDQQRSPIEGATVVLQADYKKLATETTNSDGKATLKFPPNARVDWINALKDGAGYDYYENYDAFPSQDRLEVPDEIQLTLRGAVPVTVTVVDDLNKPVVDAMVSPWTLKLPDKLSYANVGGALHHWTDASGTANLKWLPKNLSGRCTLLVHHQDYHCAKAPNFEPGDSTDVKIDVFRNCLVSGKVTFADGTPAAGIRLQGEGRGATNFYFRGHTTTGDDGSYEIKIYPNQNTILAVTDKNYAAKSAIGIELKPGQNDNADFVLTTGTLIHGTLTVGPDKAPQDGNATLIQKDKATSLVRWSYPDPEGYYFFRVGPGTYSLQLPGDGDRTVVVKDEKEIVHDSHIERPPRGTLTGKITDADGNPVAGAEIRGESVGAPGHAGFRTRTDEEGRFTTERWTDEMLVYAVSEKLRLAGMTNITPDDKETNLTLKPAAMVHGSAEDKKGNVLAGNQVQLSFSPIVGGGTVNFAVKTDSDGKFAFPAAPGFTCKAYLRIGNRFTDSKDAIIEKTKRYELEPFREKVSKDKD